MPTYGGGVTTTAPISDAALLREHGLRVTAGRLAVLSALGRSPHVDAETIRQRLGHAAPSLQAVHNILADLTEAGLVRRFEPARSPARYERRVGDNHHHAVCRRCGEVFDVECVAGEAPCMSGPTPSGFAVETAELIFWGVCAACAAQG